MTNSRARSFNVKATCQTASLCVRTVLVNGHVNIDDGVHKMICHVELRVHYIKVTVKMLKINLESFPQQCLRGYEFSLAEMIYRECV